jgi:hypothetical protein
VFVRAPYISTSSIDIWMIIGNANAVPTDDVSGGYGGVGGSGGHNPAAIPGSSHIERDQNCYSQCHDFCCWYMFPHNMHSILTHLLGEGGFSLAPSSSGGGSGIIIVTNYFHHHHG